MNGLAMYATAQQLDQEQLVLRHAPLVKRIAHRLISRLPPSVQLDDLMQAGMIGLLEAVRNYDPSQGASLETYAGIRIQGAMLDEVRRADWTPRSVHRKVRALAEAVRTIENREGRDAHASEVAEALGVGLGEYHEMVQDAAGCRVLSFEESIASGDGFADDELGDVAPQEPGPLLDLERQAFKKALADAIAGLPDRERLVMSLYYDDELNLREIGCVLGVTESRACQLHGQALVRLRARMAGWADVND